MVAKVFKQRYAIQKQLGRTAGRRMLLAEDLQTNQLVAIKILTFDREFQWDDLKLFEREAQTLQSLSHPAIPRYLDYFKFQTSRTTGFALVQSYIEAKSLEEWVNLGRIFNVKEITQLAEALLEILMYLHQQNPPVIHRDLKPSNILLGEGANHKIGQVYLVDFGSVQTLVRREGSTITVVGTYGYMPPEQFGGRAVPASDLYSLGATLIYLVTGKHPADLPQQDLRIQFKPKIHLSSDFMDWLNEMTNPDLNNRLTSALEAIEELKKVIQGKGLKLVVQKPYRSKVKLNKDKNRLEIIIPSSFWNGHLIMNLISTFFTLLYISLLSLTMIGFLMGLFSTFLLIDSHIIYYILFFISAYIDLIVLLFILQSTKLKIDRKKIYLTHQWLGIIDYQVQPSSLRQNISQLGVLHHQKVRGVDRSLQIWAGTREYRLQTEHLTECEIDWIADELSQWLNLPIK